MDVRGIHGRGVLEHRKRDLDTASITSIEVVEQCVRASIKVEALGRASERVVCTAAEDAACIIAGNKSAAEGRRLFSINQIARAVLKVEDVVGARLINNRAAVRCGFVQEVVGATIANEDITTPVADEYIG